MTSRQRRYIRQLFKRGLCDGFRDCDPGIGEKYGRAYLFAHKVGAELSIANPKHAVWFTSDRKILELWKEHCDKEPRSRTLPRDLS